MRHVLPILLSAAMVLVLLPTAAAQGPSAYTVVVTIAPPTEPVRDEGLLLVQGKVEVAGDASMYLFSMNGIPVRYQITQAPAWASVVVSPGSDVIYLDAPNGPTAYGARTFTVSIAGSNAMPENFIDSIEITATVTPPAPSGAKSAAQSFHVMTSGDGEDCDEGHAAQTASASEPADEPLAAPAEEDDLTVQTGGATPVGTWYALGGFGLAGVGAGAFVLRRRKA